MVESKFNTVEMNGDATIRGTIGGSIGTFSGKFSADTINAVESINIRDGAVSTYYIFSTKNEEVNGNFSDVIFTVPGQSFDAVYSLFLVVDAKNGYDTSERVFLVPHILLHKDNLLVSEDYIINVSPSYPETKTICFIDVIPKNKNVTYKFNASIHFQNSTSLFSADHSCFIHAKSPVMVECRKR